MILGAEIEVRAVRLKAMRAKKGLTQRKLAHDLGISQNYIPAIEASARHAGTKLSNRWSSTSAVALRVIAETCDNAAVFLHYLVWRNRLPLGERMTAIDEIDLWGSYLLSERFGMLAEGGRTIVGNSTTDFDAYYNGLLGHGPKRKAPGKFLREPVKAFVERMAAVRPHGWREASGACLDLSVPELGVVCGKAKEVAVRATVEGQPVLLNLGRVALVGIPRPTSRP